MCRGDFHTPPFSIPQIPVLRYNSRVSYYSYIVQCADGSLYTGWTNDLEKRLDAHNSGTGSRYTRSRLPVKLVAWFEHASQSDAMKDEYRIKTLTRPQKLALIQQAKTMVKKQS